MILNIFISSKSCLKIKIINNFYHRKYNSSKQVIEAMKENEIKYKNCIKEFEESLKKYEDKYMRLKMHATEQMNK